jgi:hypothetical protein
VLAAYDINIISDGEKWQPIEPVVVSIRSEALAEVDEVSVFHMDTVE